MGFPIFLQMSDSFTQLISHTGVFAKSILVILLVLSVVSWTIMVEKYRFFRSASKGTKRFLKAFKRAGSIRELQEAAARNPDSPEAQVVSSVIDGVEAGELKDAAMLDEFVDSTTTGIVSQWEGYLIFLATTATVSPFLGLLGTVWGIMSSFLSMGLRGSANLYVVGPGIAEALITTIFGLGAAIPAVIGYNYILRVIRRKEDELILFNTVLKSRLLSAGLLPGRRP